MCCQAPAVVHVSCITRRCVGGGVLGSMYVIMNMQLGPTPTGIFQDQSRRGVKHTRLAQVLFPCNLIVELLLVLLMVY